MGYSATHERDTLLSGHARSGAEQSLIDFLEGGEALDRFLQTYPAIAREQVLAILDFAHSQIRDTVSPFHGVHKFHDAKSFQELAREQDVKPVANIADLGGVFSESDALDDLLEQIYRERE